MALCSLGRAAKEFISSERCHAWSLRTAFHTEFLLPLFCYSLAEFIKLVLTQHVQ